MGGQIEVDKGTTRLTSNLKPCNLFWIKKIINKDGFTFLCKPVRPISAKENAHRIFRPVGAFFTQTYF